MKLSVRRELALEKGILKRDRQNRNAKKKLREPDKGPRPRNRKGESKMMNLPGQSAKAFPRAVATRTRTGVPFFQSDGETCRIRHRELVGTIPGSVAFAVTAYALNPGVAATFPWLSTQAQSWESFSFDSLWFEFISRKGTDTDGSVLLGVDYDAADPNPSSEAIMCSYQGTIETPPYVNDRIDLPRSDLHKIGPERYIRSGSIGGQDIKTFDCGNFLLGTTGMADTSDVGKLWVVYDVRLLTPQLDTEVTAPVNRTSSVYYLTGDQTITDSVETTVTWDTVAVNGVPLVNTSGSFTLPRGNYYVDGQLSVTGVAITDGYVRLRKNGTTIPYTSSKFISVTAGSVTAGSLSYFAYVSSVGTDTFDVRAFINATGNPAVSASGSMVRVLSM